MKKKKKNKHNQIALLANTKLNTKQVWISKALIDSYIIHDEFALLNSLLKEYDDLKDEIKNPNKR